MEDLKKAKALPVLSDWLTYRVLWVLAPYDDRFLLNLNATIILHLQAATITSLATPLPSEDVTVEHNPIE